jgi:hypothetical protein
MIANQTIGVVKANGWTDERRAKQSQAIKKWKPWEKSTGAKTPEGKAIVAKNAYKGGYRPMTKEFRRLFNVLLKDHRAELDKFMAGDDGVVVRAILPLISNSLVLKPLRPRTPKPLRKLKPLILIPL